MIMFTAIIIAAVVFFIIKSISASATGSEQPSSKQPSSSQPSYWFNSYRHASEEFVSHCRAIMDDGVIDMNDIPEFQAAMKEYNAILAYYDKLDDREKELAAEAHQANSKLFIALGKCLSDLQVKAEADVEASSLIDEILNTESFEDWELDKLMAASEAMNEYRRSHLSIEDSVVAACKEYAIKQAYVDKAPTDGSHLSSSEVEHSNKSYSALSRKWEAVKHMENEYDTYSLEEARSTRDHIRNQVVSYAKWCYEHYGKQPRFVEIYERSNKLLDNLVALIAEKTAEARALKKAANKTA